MAKKPMKSNAPAEEVTETTVTPGQDAATDPRVAPEEPRDPASTPSGENGPDGSNTPSDSGDAAGEASAELVKPQVNATPTEAILAEAEKAKPAPEAEASASGDATDEKFDLATIMAASGIIEPADLSAEDRSHLVNLLFGNSAPVERREVHVIGGPIRHNNVKFKLGKPIVLTEAEHAPLRERRLVTSWETGKVVD
ncbi:hypothetical protein [Rhizobium sp. YS-1r]|uniref:hypothetical protein n=1 Tax=Rhizobium sp. YS-1r TaxID=1532558 RepID=UPI00050DF4CE|nr:hypothetical protein [Rhizobium sp. YS-1r]KGE00999.1 hypothetical protein JL39_07595 [Rhizobium sp. YS-1r]